MKRKLLFISLVISAICLAGCGGSSSSESSEVAESIEDSSSGESAKKIDKDKVSENTDSDMVEDAENEYDDAKDTEDAEVSEADKHEASGAAAEWSDDSDLEDGTAEIVENSILFSKARPLGEPNDGTFKEVEHDDAPLTENSLGPVFFSPNSDSQVGLIPRGSNTLHAYFKRPGVKGNGYMTVYSEAHAKYCEVNLGKKKYCYAASDDGTLKDLGWDDGTHLVIKLPKDYENSDNFYVLMEEGAFSTEDGSIQSKAVTDEKVWRYDVQNYGVELTVPNGGDVYVGDEIYARIFIRQPCHKVLIEDYDENRLSFEEKEFKREDSDLRFTIKQLGEDTFNIKFFDKERNMLSVIPIKYNASMRPDPEEEKVKRNIVGL